jgi:hypothetical protein
MLLPLTLLFVSTLAPRATASDWTGCWRATDGSNEVLLLEHERAGWLRDGQPGFYRLNANGDELELERWSRIQKLRVQLEGDDRLRVQGEGVDLTLERSEVPAELVVEPYDWPAAVDVDAGTIASLREDLAARRIEDQRVRQTRGTMSQADMDAMRRVDVDNVQFLQSVVRELGWIDAERFGTDASNAAFLFVQHSSDLRLMRTALPLIEADVRAGRMGGDAYALLFDRFQLNLGYLQRYGSQIGRSEEFGSVLMPCEDLAGVDARRAEMGMGPLGEYLDLFRESPDASPPAHLTDLREPHAGRSWTQLFNGRDLDGWRVKVRGCELDDNYKNTFRVEDGVLRVSYDEYETFDGRFGHLIYTAPFSHYRLRVEYRFVGEQCPGGPGWAFRNSGVMLHGQAPESMTVDQEFPVSIEAQMLGGDGTNARSTANLCTPGTHVVIADELVRRHCTNSSSATYHGDDWVTIELEVRGNESIRHYMGGELVLEYAEPQLDEGDADAASLLNHGAPKALGSGYLSLQAESHPLEFRSVEILELD